MKVSPATLGAQLDTATDSRSSTGVEERAGERSYAKPIGNMDRMPFSPTLPMNLLRRADILVRRCRRLSSRRLGTPDWKVRCTGRLESRPYPMVQVHGAKFSLGEISPRASLQGEGAVRGGGFAFLTPPRYGRLCANAAWLRLLKLGRAPLRAPLHMQLHFGAIPGSSDFVPDASWRSLRQAPSPMLENLLALPIGVVAAVMTAALWLFVTPLRDITPAMSLPAFLLLFAGLVVVHELIHALVHPMAGLSARSILGFWASLGFYAHYDGEMSRNRLVACLLMPLLVISIVPLLVSAFAQVASGWIAFVSVINALCACVDLLLAGLILFQIPATAIVRFKSWRIYWRDHDTLAA